MESNAWKKAWENVKKQGTETSSESWKKAWDTAKEKRDSATSEDASWKKAWDKVNGEKSETTKDTGGNSNQNDTSPAKSSQSLLSEYLLNPTVSSDTRDAFAEGMINNQKTPSQKASEAVADSSAMYVLKKAVAGVVGAGHSLEEGIASVMGGADSAHKNMAAKWLGSDSDDATYPGFADQIKLVQDYADLWDGLDGFTSDDIISGIKSRTGKTVNRLAIYAYQKNEDTEKLNQSIDQEYADAHEGKISGGAAFAGNIGYAIGNMIPSIAVAVATGGSSAAGEGAGAIPTLVNSIKSGQSVGTALAATGKALFTFSASTSLMSAQAAGNKYVTSARQYGEGDFPGATLLNAIGTGAIEGITENLGGITDFASFGKIMDHNLTGNVFINIAKDLPKLLMNAVEEGGEEVISSPLEGLPHRHRKYSDSLIKSMRNTKSSKSC